MNELKFQCKNCVHDPADDNRLQLIVEEKHNQKFDIKSDGSLEYYDSDCEQEIFLECPICGAKYEFVTDENKFILQLEERHVMTKFDLTRNGSGRGDVINVNDFEIKQAVKSIL